jgi:hypothetical protein
VEIRNWRQLICEREENNPNDKFSVKLVLQRGNPGQCVGHVPIQFSKIFNYFLRRGNINVTVTGDNFLKKIHYFNKVFNFSISVLFPENVYVHDTSSSMLKKLSPVTVTFMFPRLKK